MENLDTGKDKIKRICEVLKNETLEPAREEAQKIIDAAQQEARNIIHDAEKKGETLLNEAKTKIAKERELFENSLQQAYRLSIASLKQNIEEKLFNSGISEWLDQQSIDVNLTAKLINALVTAIEKEGISTNFSAIVSEQIPPEKVNALLLQAVIEKLREKSVIVGEGIGGVQLKLHDRKFTLDLSTQALKELVSQYIRKDFREILFVE